MVNQEDSDVNSRWSSGVKGLSPWAAVLIFYNDLTTELCTSPVKLKLWPALIDSVYLRGKVRHRFAIGEEVLEQSQSIYSGSFYSAVES